MKIAYFIMLHDNFPQLRWLLNAIYTYDDLFLIHIDKKSSPSFFNQVHEYAVTRPNIEFLPSHNVTRFGWSVVNTELRAIRALVSSKREWEYLINLSGRDYPIKSIDAIKTKLSLESPNNFIEVIPRNEMAKGDPHLERRLSFEMFHTVVKTPTWLAFPKIADIKYKGSAWFMITRDFCEWLLSNRLTAQIGAAVKYWWNPDELFFQALVMNSPYRNTLTEHYGREIIWPGGTASPKTLTMEDYERLSASPALFARKFDEAVDRQILVSLACDHRYQIPNSR
jgi:hypothetical protein